LCKRTSAIEEASAIGDVRQYVLDRAEIENPRWAFQLLTEAGDPLRMATGKNRSQSTFNGFECYSPAGVTRGSVNHPVCGGRHVCNLKAKN